VVNAAAQPIDWNKSTVTPSQANINQGPLQGCDGDSSFANTIEGSDDWSDLAYRFTAALDFGSGAHPTANEHVSIDPNQAERFFLAADLDGNDVGDASDCGTYLTGVPQFTCKHRIDIKPSSKPDPSGAKIINLGADAVVSIAIFSEVCSSSSDPLCPQPPSYTNGLWDATKQVLISCQQMSNCDPTEHLPVFHVESENIPVKTNASGDGTCSFRDVLDPVTGKKDGNKDLICGFDTSGLTPGSYTGYVTGYFTDPNKPGGNKSSFQGKQDFIVVP
jgi:hypothetical protein